MSFTINNQDNTTSVIELNFLVETKKEVNLGFIYFILQTIVPTRFNRFEVLFLLTRLRVPVAFLRLPPLRLYLRVYLALTFAPFAHFLAAALNFARHAVLPLVFLPFNCCFIQV